MSYRCINAFEFNNRIYSGGAQVADGDPILTTHRSHFAVVQEESPAEATEVATSNPGETRAVSTSERRGKSAAGAKNKSEETGS